MTAPTIIYQYTCIVCDRPTNYWWLYCEDHELECDRDMEPKQDFLNERDW